MGVRTVWPSDRPRWVCKASDSHPQLECQTVRWSRENPKKVTESRAMLLRGQLERGPTGPDEYRTSGNKGQSGAAGGGRRGLLKRLSYNSGNRIGKN